jgi:serine/threonine protein kinase
VLRGDGNNLAAARFKILGPLGAGGFGAVYEAVDVRTGQHVALKQLDDTSAESIARFKHEFRALADCHHENLVGLKELIEQDGRWLIVMELVPGMDFLRYVQRPANDNVGAMTYDEPRLRGALSGMVEGLRALHTYGVVHRDLKPSNVRVRPDGRAVLLDFGLATSVDPKKQSTHAMGVGTVIYMAPEQAGGQSIGPACDLYALGVCLFEAVTGRAPFEGNHAIKIMLEKQREEAPRASSLVAQVPTDLDELAARLLAIDPGARPSAEEVLRILNKGPLTATIAPAPLPAPEEVFAGRDAELSHLDRALSRTHESELRVVLIEGESGVGKSELISEFLRRVRERQPQLVALRGRCYENEQVSYKAFDGCIDELAKVLRRMPESELKAILPPRAALLGQLFPVLRNVKSIATAAREGISADPSARRLEAFAALAHLLSRLAEERPVVLVLDDLQWADAESFRLLGALSQQTPRPPILLAGTVRPREELDGELRERLEEVRKWQHTDVVPLFGLPRAQAKALAKQLLPENTPDAWLESIADESHGHPLFMSELIQYTASHDFAARGSLTLEAALRARIDRLGRKERELLEMVAIAARPHPLPVFAAALSCDLEEVARSLLKAKLLRQRRGHELGVYHDRIRHAAVDLIAKSRLPVLHHQLAAALVALPDGDTSEQAHHWDLSGQPERACGAYEDAATKALDALAFTRAAQLCERALELLGRASDERVQRLTIQRADALACAGRSGEAAKLYQQAADAAQGDARIKLRSRAALHLILSARVSVGFEAARQLLGELGFKIPRGTTAGLLRYAWEALKVAFARKRENAAQASPRELVALGVVREMLYTVGIVNPLAYVVLAIQYVRRAENAGSPIHSALAITTRGWFRALHGSLEKARPLIARGRSLVEGNSDPLAVANQAYAAGSAYTAGFDPVGSAEQMELAQRIVQEKCPDNPWLLTSIRYHLGANWYHCGEHARLAREVEGWIAEARERNDTFGVALLVGMGHGFARHLMRDAPDAAISELEASAGLIPVAPYSFPHLGSFFGTAICHLYQGGPAALRYLEAHEAQHKKSFLLSSATGVGARLMYRMFALLAASVNAGREERALSIKQAKEVANRLRRERSPQLTGYAHHVLAQIAALEGQRELGLAHAREALATFHAAGIGARRTAKYLVGLLEGGRSGREKCADMFAEMLAMGWCNQMRAISVTTPLLPLLIREEHASLPSAQQRLLLLDRYEITDQLGSGGFGTVVAARDVHSGRMVAIKELTRTGADSIERFKLEFRALAALPHENIVQLEALFEHNGTWYIAMELVEGTDLVSYVRESGAVDAERLRATFAGVSRGLLALHRTGFVHRDVKSENVVVTHEGRAVLIDFGLSARTGDVRESGSVGSLAYAAPEQLKGASPTPAADVHALGACLYHTLYGRPPYENGYDGPAGALRDRAPPRMPSLPGLEDLSALCKRMLAEAPEARPPLIEVLTALSGSAEHSQESLRPMLPRTASGEFSVKPSFCGREPELARLTAALAKTEHAGFSLAIVEGESGLGKSELVREVARRWQASAKAPQLLSTRCYENELVAFKAFDRAVDQLAKLLRELARNECEALLPKRAALLAQLFPVLGGVAAIADAPKKGLPADPAARKQAGRECFIQLLENLSGRASLLILIDDLQWADSESFDLLRALARRGASLPLVILCTVRPKAELDAAINAEMASLQGLSEVTWVLLDALEPGACTELARQLLGDEIDEARLARLVTESKGHPLFLHELVEHEKSGLAKPRSALTLDGVLTARIESLSPDARELLTLVALADKPYGAHVYTRALARAEPPREALLALLQHGLLQRRAEKLACSHDRIRRAALSRLGPEARRHAANKLAQALTREPRTDAAERARLWDEAGEQQPALEAYEQAGHLALEGLAFARAEQHFGRALELLGDADEDPRVQRLLVARGHALVSAGRSAHAARLFQRAAVHATGEEALRLRLWAAQHLLQSAQVEEGLRAASQLVQDVGLSLPASDAAAKLRIGWERARVRMRGIEQKQRAFSAHEHLMLEVLHGLCAPVRAISLLPGSALVAQYLRRALDTGHPVHAARALAHEAFIRVLNRPERDQDALFERSHSLAQATGEPALLAEVDLLHGLACNNQRRFRAAPTYLWRAHDLLSAQCPGESWLLTASRMYMGSAWLYSGNFREIQRHAEGWMEEARARDDRYAVAAIAGFGAGSLRHAMNEQPELALAELEAAMAPWPKEPFATTHYGAFSTTYYVLGSEPGPRLLQYLEQRRDVEHASVMRTPPLRFAYLAAYLRGLLLAIESPKGPGAAELVARTRQTLRAMARLPGRTPRVFALGTEASLHCLAGDREAALRCLRASEELARGVDHFCGIGIRYMLATLEGGEAARAVQLEIRAQIEASGWKNWERGLALHVPGNLALLRA